MKTVTDIKNVCKIERQIRQLETETRRDIIQMPRQNQDWDVENHVLNHAVLWQKTCISILHRRFDIVTVFAKCRSNVRLCCRFGNHVERKLVLSTKWKQIEHAQFVSTLLKRRNFTKTRHFDIVAVFVAGVDGALAGWRPSNSTTEKYSDCASFGWRHHYYHHHHHHHRNTFIVA